MPIEILVPLTLMACIALVYASVGHGGASGYLAIMALFSFAPETLRSTALVLNIFVSGIAFYQYSRKKHFDFKLFLPFAIGSIPFAFLGGRIQIDPYLYKIILGVFLLLAVLKLLNFFGSEKQEIKPVNFPIGVLVGSTLGFFSGLIGIGGGIILSPIILILGWGNMKTTAAVSALFIFCNSISGISGLFVSHQFQPTSHLYLFITVVSIGGLIGGYLGSAKLPMPLLKKTLAIVLVFASFKLILL